MWVCTPPLHHRAPDGRRARGGHPRLPREADRAHAGRRRGDRRGRRGRGDAVCASRLPVARDRAARRRPPGARGPAGGDARRPQLRPGERPAVVRRPRPGRRPAARARQPPHRPAAGDRRRDRGGADDGRRRCGSPRPTAPRGNIDDAITLVFHFASGALGCVHSGLVARRPARALRHRHPGHRRDDRARARPRPASASPGRSAGRDVAAEYGEPMHRSIDRLPGGRPGRRSGRASSARRPTPCGRCAVAQRLRAGARDRDRRLRVRRAPWS